MQFLSVCILRDREGGREGGMGRGQLLLETVHLGHAETAVSEFFFLVVKHLSHEKFYQGIIFWRHMKHISSCFNLRDFQLWKTESLFIPLFYASSPGWVIYLFGNFQVVFWGSSLQLCHYLGCYQGRTPGAFLTLTIMFQTWSDSSRKHSTSPASIWMLWYSYSCCLTGSDKMMCMLFLFSAEMRQLNSTSSFTEKVPMKLLAWFFHANHTVFL